MTETKIHALLTIRAMQEEIYEVNEANGWYESERTFGDDIALLHTEVSEMFEAYRDHQLQDATATPACDCPVSTSGIRGLHHSTDCAIFRTVKPEGVGSEAADVLIRLLDTCKRRGIDLEFEYRRKLAFNKTRGYRHGGKHI